MEPYLSCRTVEELTAGRRLVKLYRRQTGTRIEMHFHQLPADQYDPTAVAISCIWNQNLEDYVVTYADIVSHSSPAFPLSRAVTDLTSAHPDPAARARVAADDDSGQGGAHPGGEADGAL